MKVKKISKDAENAITTWKNLDFLIYPISTEEKQ